MYHNNKLSYIRAMSCIGIVFLHTFTMCGMAFSYELTGNKRFIVNLVPYLMMWAVPCFVMVTGALLLDKNRNISYKKVFTRYIPRVLGALVICGFIFRLLDVWMNKEQFSGRVFGEALYKIYTGTGWAHLWYLYLMIGLYLLMPFFHKIANGSSRNELSILIAIYIIFVSLVPIADDITGTDAGFYIVTNSIFPCYLFIGHMMVSGKWKVSGFVNVLNIILGITAIIVISYKAIGDTIDVASDKLTGYLGSYSFFPVILLSTGIFGLICGVKTGETKEPEKSDSVPGIMGKILLVIDDCSIGIYLVHLIFLRYIYKCTDFTPLGKGGIISVVGIAILTFILSFILVWLLKRIKPVNKVL